MQTCLGFYIFFVLSHGLAAFSFAGCAAAGRVKPKPLYRSITFWSGILVMTSIPTTMPHGNLRFRGD
jgi:hypothetical protein